MVCFRGYLCCFHLDWVLGARGGGPPKGLVDNLLMHLYTLGGSKIEVSRCYVFDIVIAQNSTPNYVWFIVRSVYAVFTLYGYWVRAWGGGGGPSYVYSDLVGYQTSDIRLLWTIITRP